MDTLLLDPAGWDLCLDASGNIALAQAPYAMAQDIASAARLFAGECWYDQTRGVPYFRDILGQRPPLTLFKGELNAAALTVPGVAQARTFFSANRGREVQGQIHATTQTGVGVIAQFPLSRFTTGFTVNVSQIAEPPGVGLRVIG